MVDGSNIQFAKRYGITYGKRVMVDNTILMSWEWPDDEILIHGYTFKELNIGEKRVYRDPDSILWMIVHEVLHSVIFACMYDGTEESVYLYNNHDDHWAFRNGLDENMGVIFS